MSSTPQSPQLIYRQTDPRKWDPYSRADRIGKVNDYCIHPDVTDAELRKALDFMELKVKTSLEADLQAEVELATRDGQRNLFNYRYVPFSQKRSNTETAQRTSYSHVSEYILNCIQISEIALSRGMPKAAHRAAYYRGQIKQNSWIEKNFLNRQSEITNTFLLSHILEAQLSRIRSATGESFGWRLPKALSERAIEAAFEQLSTQRLFSFAELVSPKHSSDQRELLLVRASQLAFFAFAHEVIENAMCHGVHSSINSNVPLSGIEDFGRIFFLQSSTEKYSERSAYDLNAFPESFAKYYAGISGLFKRAPDHFSVLTFFDTGIGVQRHLRKFGGEDKLRTITEISQNHLSARPIIGSGKGFMKMKTFASSLKAFLSVTTSESIYTFNGISGEENEEGSGRVHRGTKVSIFLGSKR
jgi:hypothetical protein